MILVKDTVRFRKLIPEIYDIFPAIDLVWGDRGLECVITSANDSQHKQGSLHYEDRAIDLRSHDLPPGDETEVVEELKELLGLDYQVLLEDRDTPNEHLHIAWRPHE